MPKIAHAQTVLLESDIEKLGNVTGQETTKESLSEAVAFTIAHRSEYRAWREAQK